MVRAVSPCDNRSEAAEACEGPNWALLVIGEGGISDLTSEVAALSESAESGAAQDRSLLLTAALSSREREKLAKLTDSPALLHEIAEGTRAAPGRIYFPPDGQTPVLQPDPEGPELRFGLTPAESTTGETLVTVHAGSTALRPGGGSVLSVGDADGPSCAVRAQVERMIEAGQAGFWDWYVQDNTAFMSPLLKAMLGFGGGELGTSAAAWRQRVHPEDLPRLQQAFRAHVESRGKQPFDLELRYLRKDGATIWGHCRGQVVAWRGAAPSRVMGILSDVTDLRRREAKLDEIRDFALMAAHDLMAPANTIAGGLSMLHTALGEAVDDEAQEVFGIASRAADKLRARIGAVVDLFRIESTEVAFEPVDLEACFRDAVDLLRDEVAHSGAEVSVGPLPMASGGPLLIGQLAQNLLINALKYRHPERQPLVRVAAFDAGPQMVGVRVSDNGLGIPREQRERVFELFHRLRADSALGGSGLGLALCERVVTQHGGRIWVEDGDAGGAALLFTLPRGRRGRAPE